MHHKEKLKKQIEAYSKFNSKIYVNKKDFDLLLRDYPKSMWPQYIEDGIPFNGKRVYLKR